MALQKSLSSSALGQARRLAEEWALAAGTIALANFGRTRSTRKADASVVTETDHQIQSMILGEARRSFPDHSFCGEEGEHHRDSKIAAEGAQYCWVIDPLDGTRNYVAQVPCFATSIALLDCGRPVVGVIREHNTGRLFSAEHGGGAYLDGESIRVNQLGEGDEHLVGVPSSKDELAVRVGHRWHGTPGLVCRNMGSTAFEMGLIASGAMSAMLCRRVKIWDIAAGVVLIREAGGVITDPLGKEVLPFRMDADPQDNIPILAASVRMHGVLLDSIRTAMA